MRPGAELLLIESDALAAVLEGLSPEDFDRPTVCVGWSVRDVLAHCGAALTAAATGELHRFTPQDNEGDVEVRRAWPLGDVLEELRNGYRDGAVAVDAAAGRLDAIAIGEWMHGGDVRAAVGAVGAYSSDGIDIALVMLAERSRTVAAKRVTVDLDGRALAFGAGADATAATLRTDVETFVRLCGNRRPDPARYSLMGAAPADLVLFT